MEEIGVISLCLECENFSGKPKYIAKRNNGIKSVNTRKNNWCLKHDVDLMLIDSPKGLVPDIAECESFNKK
jgi:hypothetical protein